MYNRIKPGANEHVIEVERTVYGYSVTHKKGKQLLFTASYQRESEARRVSSSMANQLDVRGETVWLCLNYATPPAGRY